MHTYYISTDAGSQEITAESAGDAVMEFLDDEGGPPWVNSVATLERWLEKVGGYGFMRDETTGEELFHIPM